MIGGAGRDLLIGGTGNDILIAGSGQDILIGGTTRYDANDAALQTVMKEWTSRHDYTTRVKNILGVTTEQGNAGFATRLNANYFPNSGTVQDDGSTDIESGGGGWDWFFANTDCSDAGHDVVVDATRHEVVTNIDFDA